MHFRYLLSTLACALVFCFLAGCGVENKSEANQRNASDVLNDARRKQLTRDLSLSSEQADQVKALLDEEAKAAAKFQNDPGLSVMEKSNKLTALRDETASKIKPLLTPAQLEKFEEALRKSARRRRSN